MSTEVMQAVQTLVGIATFSLFSTVIAIGAANANAVRQHGLACVAGACGPKLARVMPAKPAPPMMVARLGPL